MIKNIILDLGGVLLDIDLPYCMHSVETLGVDLSALPQPSPSNDTTNMKPAVMGEGVVANGMLNQYQIGMVTTHDFLTAIQGSLPCRHHHEASG